MYLMTNTIIKAFQIIKFQKKYNNFFFKYYDLSKKSPLSVNQTTSMGVDTINKRDAIQSEKKSPSPELNMDI